MIMIIFIYIIFCVFIIAKNGLKIEHGRKALFCHTVEHILLIHIRQQTTLISHRVKGVLKTSSNINTITIKSTTYSRIHHEYHHY